MIKKILAPFDFTKASNNSLRFVNQFGTDINADIYLLNVMPHYASDLPDELRAPLLKKEKDKRHRKLVRLLGCYPNRDEAAYEKTMHLHSIIKEGDIVQQILATSEAKKVDLIVIGTRAKHSIENYFLGSVSTELIRHTSIPILVIPEGCTYHQFRKMAFANSDHRYEAPNFQYLQQLATFLGASLTQFYIHTLPYDISTKKEEIIPIQKSEDETTSSGDITIVRDRTVMEGIDYFVQKNQPDLLALYLPERSKISQFLHRSKAKQLVYHSKVPLLLYSPTSRNEKI